MKLRLTFAFACALLSLYAQAQSSTPPPPRPRPPVAWWENPVANGLTLTETQKDRIGHIVRDHKDRLATDRQEVDRAERELEGVFNADTIDFQKGKLVTDQLVKARSELTQDMVRMTLRLRAVLTPEQWKTLQDRNAAAPATKGDRGRGGKSGVPHIH